MQLTKLRTIIADDEELGRAGIREMLTCEPDFEVVGECGDGAEALTMIRATGADVAFLDIHMPGLSGLEVARRLGEARAAIVFVTAFDQHAVEAFDRFAVDYVVKPLDPERFGRALSRLRRRLAGPSMPDRRVVEQLAAALTARGQTSPCIALQTPGRTVFLDPSEFLWAEAAGNYVHVHTEAGALQVRTTMGELLAKLEGLGALRIHRAFLVSRAHVRELRSIDGVPGARIVLRDGTELPVGRTYRAQVADELGTIS